MNKKIQGCLLIALMLPITVFATEEITSEKCSKFTKVKLPHIDGTLYDAKSQKPITEYVTYPFHNYAKKVIRNKQKVFGVVLSIKNKNLAIVHDCEQQGDASLIKMVTTDKKIHYCILSSHSNKCFLSGLVFNTIQDRHSHSEFYCIKIPKSN